MSDTYKPPQEQIDAIGKLPVDEVLKIFIDREHPDRKAAWYHYGDVMDKARRGAIATPERMALLYPIFREIAEELQETELVTEERNLSSQLRKVRKERKELQSRMYEKSAG